MNKKEQLELYHQMVLIRRLEERGAELYQQGKIGGFMHLYIGQEAVCTGLIAARQPNDRVITAYRDHGVAISCGVPATAVMAELLGKATGTSKGKGGSMHMADTQKNFWGGHAIVGAHLPIAMGMALGDAYGGRKNVTICMFGEGATNIGFFHEAVNMSKVWKLPVLWVCENNVYGMGTAVDRASAVSSIATKARGYDMPSERVDGMDVMQVYEASQKAIEQVRAGNGPFLLEFTTYRFRGHSMGDPERYRKSDEVKKWEESDPIGMFRRSLTEGKVASGKNLDEIDEKVMAEVEEAVQFAEASPEPTLESLYENIYAD
ncbi:MAG TPA: pyruvate dehydrogenase (acetyl-transferring) E1 component subunit alpha [Anaerolineales bacterium]|nr:pyruvate dehydrogenase (acetyl-transferring) E1 component subunit alpha [Anaerolineales bacterium]